MIEVGTFHRSSSSPSIVSTNSSSCSTTTTMYDFSATRSKNKMPVDFAAYLMSSSPPLGFSNLSITDHFCDFRNVGLSKKAQHDDVATPPLRPVIVKANDDWDSLVIKNNDANKKENLSNKTGKLKKSVSFADTRGLSLTKVRFMTEPSDVPPNLQRIQCILSSAYCEDSVHSDLILDFNQPASDYVSFRNKLDTQCVCLENVLLKDFHMAGTVKVKNITFHKAVFVRWTCDKWESFISVSASYVAVGDESASLYDTFAFEICVPKNISRKAVVEFAICFECNGQQFWDNNGGDNYKVHFAEKPPEDCPQITQYTAAYKPNYEGINCWTEYASWTNIDGSVPYY